MIADGIRNSRCCFSVDLCPLYPLCSKWNGGVRIPYSQWCEFIFVGGCFYHLHLSISYVSFYSFVKQHELGVSL